MGQGHKTKAEKFSETINRMAASVSGRNLDFFVDIDTKPGDEEYMRELRRECMWEGCGGWRTIWDGAIQNPPSLAWASVAEYEASELVPNSQRWRQTTRDKRVACDMLCCRERFATKSERDMHMSNDPHSLPAAFEAEPFHVLGLAHGVELDEVRLRRVVY